MKSVKCDSCGSVSEIKDGTISFKCSYCGVTKVMDTDNLNIHRDTPNETTSSKYEHDIKIKNAAYLMNMMHDYDKAYEIYLELFNEDKNNKDVLEGLMITITHNFDPKNCPDFDLFKENDFEYYLSLYEKLEDKISKVSSYYKKFNKFLPLVREENSHMDEIDKTVDNISDILAGLLVLAAFVVYLLASVIRALG